MLSLVGDFDIAATASVTAVIDDLDIGGRTKQLIIDLRELDFMDSSGATLLYARDAAARADGHNLTVVRGRPEVQRLVRMVGIEERIIFVDDPRELRPPV
jgi:anti-anti-sigma factor